MIAIIFIIIITTFSSTLFPNDTWDKGLIDLGN